MGSTQLIIEYIEPERGESKGEERVRESKRVRERRE